MKVKNGKSLTKILTLIALMLAAFVAFEFFSLSKKSPKTVKTSAEKIIIKNFTITSILDTSHLITVTDFLAKAMKNAYLASEIIFTEDKNAKIPTYIATWEKNSKKISLMVWLTTDKKYVSYIRVWTLDPMEKLDNEISSKRISDIGNETLMQNIRKFKCTESFSKNDQKTTLTECSFMIVQSDGNSIGATVRSPVEHKSSKVGTMSIEKKTASSLCFIPKEGKTLYQNTSCL
jgi:hypothetical protein